MFGGPAAGVKSWGPKHTGAIRGNGAVLVPGVSVGTRCRVRV